MNTAEEAGLERDEFGHMGSLDPRTGMVLKGRKHESWNPMVQEEMYRGNTVMYNPNEDRYFSIEGGMYEPAVQDETDIAFFAFVNFLNFSSNSLDFGP